LQATIEQLRAEIQRLEGTVKAKDGEINSMRD
jgi:chromosome segregation ATPase